jgi:hypothetical protein
MAAAEIIGFAGVLDMFLGRGGVHGHAADGIKLSGLCSFNVVGHPEDPSMARERGSQTLHPGGGS